MKISKQKRNLINELSFYILINITESNEIKESKSILRSCIYYTNKQIKTLIHDLKYQLPFKIIKLTYKAIKPSIKMVFLFY